jgi:serine/threonine protein phosphatase PrpC
MADFRFLSHGLTHVGLVRRRNEDAFLDRPDLGLWTVADGMGGHEAGDVASAAIIDALGRIAPPADLSGFVELVRDALLEVDRALRERAATLGPGVVIGSTSVSLLARGAAFAGVWAGDSRLYRLRDSIVAQLTTDHSRVQELIDRGLLREEDAEHHPAAHIVTQAVGAGQLEFGVVEGDLGADDTFLLCSDGLSRVVRPMEIARALAAAPRHAATELLDLVLARGAPDNVTIVVVRPQLAG